MLTEEDRKKAALIRLRKLLPAFGRKLDRDLRKRPLFADLADKVAVLLGLPTKA